MKILAIIIVLPLLAAAAIYVLCCWNDEQTAFMNKFTALTHACRRHGPESSQVHNLLLAYQHDTELTEACLRFIDNYRNQRRAREYPDIPHRN